MPTIIHGDNGVTFPDSTVQGTALTTGAQVIAGAKTFSSPITVPALPTLSAVQSMVRLNTGNGLGSTNTAIRRFTTTVTNQGSDITYADSAANGASFTINTSGVYSISYNDAASAGASNMGVSVNSSQLTTDVASITAADRLVMATTASASVGACVATTVYLTAGAVVRPHGGTALNAGAVCQFTITRVS